MIRNSCGLGHQVCTDYLQRMDAAKDGIRVVDRQLACVRVSSAAGRDYLAAMRAAANFAFVNRTLLANDVRRAFAQVFEGGASLGMRQVYDVAHNMAKEEEHVLPGDTPGRTRRLLVHRKGATRAFPPGHPDVPARYAAVGQPVLVGGSMSSASYVLAGTEGAMARSLGSTCHGAGRALSRAKALKTLDSGAVLRACAPRSRPPSAATRAPSCACAKSTTSRTTWPRRKRTPGGASWCTARAPRAPSRRATRTCRRATAPSASRCSWAAA